MNNSGKNRTVFWKFSYKISKLWNSSYSSAITNHDDGQNADNSFIIGTIRQVPAKKYVFDPVKGYLSKAIDSSYIIRKLFDFFEYLLSLSLKCYGCFILTFTAISILFDFLGNSFSEKLAVFSAVVILSFFPTLFSSKSISAIISESCFFSYLFIELLHCEKLIFYAKKESHGSISGSFIVGFIGSFLSLVYKREEIILVVLLMVVTSILMCRPETGALALSFIFPFCPIGYAIYFSAVCMLSYLIKVIRGKRNLYFNLYDVPVLLFLGFYIAIKGTEGSIGKILIFSLIYFLFSGMMRTKELLRKCIVNIFLGSSVYAAFNIAVYFLTAKSVSFNLFFTGAVRKGSAFADLESFSAFYACAFVIGFLLFIFSSEKKRIVFLGLVLNFIALCFCGVEFAAISCLFAVVSIFLSLVKNKIVVLFVSTAAITICYEFFSVFSNTVNGLSRAVDLCLKYKKSFLFGTEKSDLIYDIEGVADAGNLWVQLSFWGGIIFAVVIFWSSVVFIRNGFTVGYSGISFETQSISVAVSASVFSYVVSSFGGFLWNDYRVFALFWILGGLSSATRRVLRKENNIAMLHSPNEV